MGKNLKIKTNKTLFSLILILSLNFILFPTSNLKIDTTNENFTELNVSNSLVYLDVLINDLPFSPNNWTWAETQPWFDGGLGILSDPYIIENHIFEYSAGLGDCFALVNSEKYFIIRNCTFRNSASSSSGIHLINVTNGQFINNRMINNYNGFKLSDCYSNLFDSNVVLDSSYVGIWGESFNEYNTYTNNFVNNSRWGIALEDGNNNEISNNVVLNMDSNDGILIYGTGNNSIIQNNYINNCNIDGIRVEVSDNCIVSHNTIKNCDHYGLYFDLADNNLAFENYFRNNFIHAYDTGVNNDWNSSTIGNYWDNYTGYDMNVDGIGDKPYTYIGGSAGSIDFLPIWNIRSPIAINDLPSSLNNWTWAETQPWFGGGSGTSGDPYIIENLNIDANLTDYCISISNSEAHFLIQGCSLNNTVYTASKGGITLNNVTNGKIDGNSFYSHKFASVYGEGNYITVSGNTLNDQAYGIYLRGSYNEILSNTIYGDGMGSGVAIQNDNSYHNNIIDGNTIENSYQGIFILASDNNTITDNTALKNVNYGIVLTSNANNNFLSGNMLLDNTLSGMVIENSISNTIEETLTDGNQQHGIYLSNADDTTIHDNNFTNNVMDGINIATGSANNLFYGNYFENNGRNAYDNGANNDWNSTTIGNYWNNYTGYDMNLDGIGDIPYTYIGGGAGSIDHLPIWNIQAPINIDDSPGSSINWEWAASQAWCSGSGSELDPYVIANLTIDARNNNPPIWIENSEVHFVIDNCELYNGDLYDGIYFTNVSNGVISNNHIYNNTSGINLDEDCHFNTISQNYVHNNLVFGIILDESNNNTILGNIVNDNGGISYYHGIAVYNSEGNLVINNTASGNNAQGIRLYQSDYNTIIGNTCFKNGENGISIETGSDHNVIEHNEVFNNSLYGLFLEECTYNNVSENTASQNSGMNFNLLSTNSSILLNNIAESSNYGFFIQSSNFNKIENCEAYDASITGIYMNDAQNNTLERNIAKYNLFGIFTEYSDHNIFIRNTCNNNTQIGIIVQFGDYNQIIENTANFNVNVWGGIIVSVSNNTLVQNNTVIGNNPRGIGIIFSSNSSTITGNIIKANYYGVKIESNSYDNLIYENFFIKNDFHAYDDGLNNDWNTTDIGNLWDNHTGPDSAPQDGIVDIPYSNIRGSAGSLDYLPIAKLAPPLITINLPISDSLYDNIAPYYDITITDEFLCEMWYTLDDGLHNHTITEFTGFVNQSEWDLLTDGMYTLKFYASDILGGIGFSSVNIEKDTLAPTINIVAPTSDETFSSSPSFIVEIFDANLDSMWYSFDGGVTNYAFTSNGTINSNAWDALSVGSVTITFYANDTLGHLAFEELTFTKSAPSGIDPIVMIIIIGSIIGGIVVIIGVIFIIKKRRKPDLTPNPENN